MQSELLGRCVDELEGELSETEMEMEMDDVRERSATFLRDKGGQSGCESSKHSHSPHRLYLQISQGELRFAFTVTSPADNA